MLDREIARLSNLAASEVRDEWHALTGSLAGKALSGDLLTRALVHVYQEKMQGGLPPAVTRRLAAIVRNAEKERTTPERSRADPARRTIMPGCRLIREWQGVMHEVMVTPGGYRWQDKTFTSLSAIAKEITGTVWNGWAFFGVSRPKRKAKSRGRPIAASTQGVSSHA